MCGRSEQMSCTVVLKIVVQVHPPRNYFAFVAVSGLSVRQRLENGGVRENTHTLYVGIITSRAPRSTNVKKQDSTHTRTN
jgi:hypothetical protein